MEFRDNRLHFQILENPETPLEKGEHYPDEKEWERFWEKVEACGLWFWGRNYQTLTLEGIDWDLEIQRGDRSIISAGANGYPGSPNDQISVIFKEFLSALSSLLDDREIWKV